MAAAAAAAMSLLEFFLLRESLSLSLPPEISTRPTAQISETLQPPVVTIPNNGVDMEVYM